MLKTKIEIHGLLFGRESIVCRLPFKGRLINCFFQLIMTIVDLKQNLKIAQLNLLDIKLESSNVFFNIAILLPACGSCNSITHMESKNETESNKRKRELKNGEMCAV